MKRKRLLALFVLPLGIAGCASPWVDAVYPAKAQDSRIKYIVLHYTWEDTPNSLRVLTQQDVSAHYLITDEEPVRVLQLVDDTQRAWHAGISQWKNDCRLNASSIGVELVNLGPRQSGQSFPLSQDEWQAYKGAQIERLIVLLKRLQQRYHIAPENIVGHSDIAPQRKVDPGPLFPWRWLAQEGVGRWYDEARVAQIQSLYKKLPSVTWAQKQLRHLGYAIEQTGQWDKQTKNVLRAFQMHYRPMRFDGIWDAETAAILDDLNQNE